MRRKAKSRINTEIFVQSSVFFRLICNDFHSPEAKRTHNLTCLSWKRPFVTWVARMRRFNSFVLLSFAWVIVYINDSSKATGMHSWMTFGRTRTRVTLGWNLSCGTLYVSVFMRVWKKERKKERKKEENLSAKGKKKANSAWGELLCQQPERCDQLP